MALSRRTFLASSLAAGALGATACSTSSRRQPRPLTDPLRLMVIGVGNRGAANLDGVAHETIAVLCDADDRQLQAAGKRFPAARLVRDFREILLDPKATAELDAVVVSTPDHTHHLPALLALQAGLDVYCEKPLALTVAEARQLRDEAERRGAVTQMGTQIHANENYHRVVEAIRAGAVGAVRDVYVFVNGTDWSAAELPAETAPPEGLDFDVWLGPSPAQPYRHGFHPMGWRRYWAFGGGTTADMACHFMDLPFWALRLDAPVAVTADGTDVHPHCAPRGLRCRYEFAALAAGADVYVGDRFLGAAGDPAARGERPALQLHWHGGSDRPEAVLAERGLQGWRNGVLFVGDDGWLISDYNKHEIGPQGRLAAWSAPAAYLPKTPSHHREWTEACKTRTATTCHFGYSGRLTEAVLLASAAFRGAKGQRIAWDAARGRTGLAAVDALLSREARDAWRI